jgi:hypothetical protein
MRTKPLKRERAVGMGYSPDKRRRRRQHRRAAKELLGNGGLLNSFSKPGSTFWQVAQWHLGQARAL